jgi:hypothetical protein
VVVQFSRVFHVKVHVSAIATDIRRASSDTPVFEDQRIRIATNNNMQMSAVSTTDYRHIRNDLVRAAHGASKRTDRSFYAARSGIRWIENRFWFVGLARRFNVARQRSVHDTMDILRVDTAIPTDGEIIGARFAATGANPFVGRAAGIVGDQRCRGCRLT